MVLSRDAFSSLRHRRLDGLPRGNRGAEFLNGATMRLVKSPSTLNSAHLFIRTPIT